MKSKLLGKVWLTLAAVGKLGFHFLLIIQIS